MKKIGPKIRSLKSINALYIFLTTRHKPNFYGVINVNCIIPKGDS